MHITHTASVMFSQFLSFLLSTWDLKYLANVPGREQFLAKDPPPPLGISTIWLMSQGMSTFWLRTPTPFPTPTTCSGHKHYLANVPGHEHFLAKEPKALPTPTPHPSGMSTIWLMSQSISSFWLRTPPSIWLMSQGMSTFWLRTPPPGISTIWLTARGMQSIFELPSCFRFMSS